jgi:hypothetical protein
MTPDDRAEALAGPHYDECGIGSGFCVCTTNGQRRTERVKAISAEIQAAEERGRREEREAIAAWAEEQPTSVRLRFAAKAIRARPTSGAQEGDKP